MLSSQRRMAAGEDEAELVVAHRSVLFLTLSACDQRCGGDGTELFTKRLASG